MVLPHEVCYVGKRPGCYIDDCPGVLLNLLYAKREARLDIGLLGSQTGREISRAVSQHLFTERSTFYKPAGNNT